MTWWHNYAFHNNLALCSCTHTHTHTHTHGQLSFSPNTPASSHAKIIILLSTVILCCAGLFMVCAIVGWQYGFNHFTFLFSEVFILFARTLHTIIRYAVWSTEFEQWRDVSGGSRILLTGVQSVQNVIFKPRTPYFGHTHSRSKMVYSE